jgi:HipA-like protein
MMRSAIVKVNGTAAGLLEELNRRHFRFTYYDKYFYDQALPAVSLTLSKSKKIHESEVLFPFFAALVAEGVNKSLQSRFLNIDKTDVFGLLLKTAAFNTIGNVTVEEILSHENPVQNITK